MGDHSGIQWTDATWNPTTGCTRVSAGCDHCYAFQLHDQRHAAYLAGRMPDAPPQYHRPFSEVQLIPERLSLPLRWTKPRRIFVDSMADLFHSDVPTEFIAEVWAVMTLAPRHTFQVLTKRPQRMKRLLTNIAFWALVAEAALRRRDQWPKGEKLPEIGIDKPLPNVWLGTSVEDQAAAYRIDWLVRTPAAVRFLSCEPLIGPLDLTPWLWEAAGPAWAGHNPSPDLGWVIVGGESGPDYRPLDIDWARSLRDQCVAAGVPYFFKQHGGRTSKAGGRELDGRTWDEMPTLLQAA
ncbi:MAG: phage Gp37/Gp68 family protein [Thermomicrobiales bacterium]